MHFSNLCKRVNPIFYSFHTLMEKIGIIRQTTVLITVVNDYCVYDLSQYS
jgi:hypothetical protein